MRVCIKVIQSNLFKQISSMQLQQLLFVSGWQNWRRMFDILCRNKKNKRMKRINFSLLFHAHTAFYWNHRNCPGLLRRTSDRKHKDCRSSLEQITFSATSLQSDDVSVLYSGIVVKAEREAVKYMNVWMTIERWVSDFRCSSVMLE